MKVKYFTTKDDIKIIKDYFNNHKRPFVIKNAITTNIDLQYLNKHFGTLNITFLNDSSEKEEMLLTQFINKISLGFKYRLRANTKIGNLLLNHLNIKFIKKIKKNKKHFFDYMLSIGRTSRQHTLFVSTKDCTFAKHAHIISGFIIQLDGKKKWYISNSRDDFWDIKYKNLIFPNPLYITEKNINNENEIILEKGDILYMPAYWFHYTFSDSINISYSYFFTESISYYLKKTFLMFAYQVITNPFFSIIKAIRKEPEEHIFHKEDIINRCNKIKNDKDRIEALEYFKNNDYS